MQDIITREKLSKRVSGPIASVMFETKSSGPWLFADSNPYLMPSNLLITTTVSGGHSSEEVYKALNDLFFAEPKVTKVIYNYPATVVYFEDKSSVVTKRQIGDTYDPTLGLLICVLRKLGRNKERIDDWEETLTALKGLDSEQMRLVSNVLRVTADAMDGAEQQLQRIPPSVEQLELDFSPTKVDE